MYLRFRQLYFKITRCCQRGVQLEKGDVWDGVAQEE